MIIFPAIDIKDGQCVRLRRGDYQTAHRVAESVVGTAKQFAEAGARWIHMVDLDGAKDAKPANTDLVFQAAEESGLHIEIGGGIRTMETVRFYLEPERGRPVSRVILGSAALKNPSLVKEAVREYGDRIAVGIDARDGKVAAEGWTDTSQVDYLELARRMEDAGVEYLIFTDIAQDGMLSGPNLEQLARLNEAVSCKVTASGGVSGIQDIRALRKLGVYGAICGKALYTGDLDLREAIRVCEEEV